MQLSDVQKELPLWRENPKYAMRTLKAFAEARRHKDAAQLLQIMRQEMVETNNFHYSAAMSACEKSGDWQLALSLLAEMQELMDPNAVSVNVAISACEKGCRWQWAMHLLDFMTPNWALERDVVSYTSAMNAYTKGSHWPLVFHLLHTMDAKPNARSFNAAIGAAVKGGRWQLAQSTLEAMIATRQLPNIISFNAAISSCESQNMWQEALAVLRGMRQHAIPPAAISFCAAMTVARREWEQVLQLLVEMGKRSLVSEAGFLNAIAACETNGRWQAALDLFFSMPDYGLPFGQMPFNSAVSACEKGQQWSLALHLFAEASDPRRASFGRRVRGDLVALNAALVACERASEWPRALLLAAQAPELNVFVVTSALRACARGLQWHSALQLLKAARARDAANERSFGAALSACEQQWPAAMFLLQEMFEVQVEVAASHLGCCALALKNGPGAETVEKFLEPYRTAWHKEAQSSGVMALEKPPDVETAEAVKTLARRLGLRRPGSASRLDRPTSGVLPVALGEDGSGPVRWLQVQFAAKLVEKEYICLCEGETLGQCGAKGSVDLPLFSDNFQESRRRGQWFARSEGAARARTSRSCPGSGPRTPQKS
ncbi:unnamed protein product [Effrenium voratum]|nr:unnamed protein product [Effrenium voratum]